MFELKSYQVNTIEAVRSFMQACKNGRAPADVFQDVARGMGVTKAKYHEPFPKVPCVCVKVPTGGGKTVIAASSIGAIDDALTQTGHPFVLWLTPSDAISQQTTSSLKDPSHPYRQAIEKHFPGAQVFSIDESENIPQCDFSRAIVLVANIQTFNIEKTAQRNAYAFNEAFEPFFAKFSASDVAGLEVVSEADLEAASVSDDQQVNVLTKKDLGRVKYSLANLIALHQPIIIVDEAHNNRTDRFFRTLSRLHPSAVLELTATPLAAYNNVICQVSAWELKDAEMVKLPIVLKGYDTEWDVCLREAMAKRKHLEDIALQEPTYLRPIMLIQAQTNTKDADEKTPTPEVVKACLMEKLGVSEEEIAIATGSVRDLDGVDLMKDDCRIRFVITIKALKEGWDCPFAYVLCSLQNIQSSKDVEQLLGRVMRMPYAKRRKNEALNRAYAFVISTLTYATASILTARLVESAGFDQTSAASLIEEAKEASPEQGDLFAEGGLEAFTKTALPLALSADTNLEEVVEASGLKPFVAVEKLPASEPGRQQVILKIDLRTPEASLNDFQEKILAKEPKANRAEIEKHIAVVRQVFTREHAKDCQAELPLFVVPQLCWQDGSEVRPIGSGNIIAWQPLAFGLDELSFKPSSNAVVASIIDVMERTHRLQDDKVQEERTDVQSVNAQPELFDLEVAADDLVRTMAQRLARPSVRHEDMCQFVDRAIHRLMYDEGFSLVVLLRNRVLLQNALEALLRKNYEKACAQGFQEQLELACPDPDNVYAFRFDPAKYPARRLYEPSQGGRWFRKHYYAAIDDLRCKTQSGADSEEYLCAVAIEQNPHVQTWVRNIPKADSAFSLALSGGRRFYPDFVASLDDGRVLVVEYKGADRVSNDDTREKCRVGSIWAQASGGKGIFLLAVREDSQGRKVAEQIADAIGR